MPYRPLARHPRARAAVVFGTLAIATLVTGCDLPGSTTGNGPQPIYAVLYGHVTAPAGRSQVTIEGRAYSDSVDAAGFGTGSGYVGGFSVVADASTNNYSTNLVAASSGTLFLTVLALGQTSSGLVYSTDTARALRVRFDSIGGGPHDSIAVNLTLP